ncbi:MAG: FecR domain-containing protein [Opitutae bacterium]|nr:FecR domain-containing protein [Opitutae bacterium]
MSNNKEWEKEMDGLLGRLVDTGLNPEEKVRLNSIMEENPGARLLYNNYMDVHGALEEHLAEPDFTSLDPVLDDNVLSSIKNPQAFPSHWRRMILAAAAVVAIGFFIQFSGQQPEAKPELPIAQITKLSGPLLWTGDGGLVNRNLQAGSKLFGGTIEGMAPDAWFELEFNDGSKVVISGNSMLTISDLGQKELRLREGSFSANVVPQPEGKPMLVRTRSALFEVMGTRFSVDAELSSSTLTVNEGKVRATRLSDGSTVEVAAKHRVVAALDCELVPEEMPDSVTLWQSHLENGSKRNHGEWMPANGAEPTHLKTVPYTLPAKDDRKQRTIHTLGMPVSQGDHPPVVLQPETKVHVRGKVASSHRIWFGMTLLRENGDFAGRFQTILPAEEFQSGEPFEVVLNLTDYHLDPSLAQWAETLPKTPYGLIVKGVWCHTLWDPAGLQVSEMALTTPTEQ